MGDLLNRSPKHTENVRHRHYNRENNEVVEFPVAHQSIAELMLLRKLRMPHAMQIRQTGGPEVLNWKVGERVAYVGSIGGYSEVRLI